MCISTILSLSIYLSPFSQSLSILKLLRFGFHVVSLRRAMGSDDTHYCLHPFILFSLPHFDPLYHHRHYRHHY